jgi:hypothetical protein
VTHKFNRVVLFSACATVISMFTAAAASCPSGDSLAQLESLGSCQIGDKIFSDFTYNYSASGGAMAVLPGSITVDTVGPGQDVSGPSYGLEFNGSWTADNGQTNDGTIGFEVTVVNGAGMEITDSGLAQTSGIFGLGGVASVSEQGCSGVGCTPGTWAVLTLQDGSTDQAAADTLLAPTGTVTVSKDINVIAPAGSFASISLVTDTFSQTAVPEPRALSLLLGLGLVAGFAFRKKLQGVRA